MNKIRIVALSTLLTTLCLISACSGRSQSVDLDVVLDVTAKTIDQMQGSLGESSNTNTLVAETAVGDAVAGQTASAQKATREIVSGEMNDQAMKHFARQLERNLNKTNPKIHPQTIGVNLKDDGSIQGYNDANDNDTQDSGEKELFLVEIDSEKNRLIATSGEYVRDHHFSGTGFLAGMLIGNMLSRQRSAGVNTSALSSKQAMSKSSYKSARTRSGSGSHSRGK